MFLVGAQSPCPDHTEATNLRTGEGLGKYQGVFLKCRDSLRPQDQDSLTESKDFSTTGNSFCFTTTRRNTRPF